jgi:hypothetical protein
VLRTPMPPIGGPRVDGLRLGHAMSSGASERRRTTHGTSHGCALGSWPSRIAGMAVREPAPRSGPPVFAWDLQALTFHSRVIAIPEAVVKSTIRYECGKITDPHSQQIIVERYEPVPYRNRIDGSRAYFI